MPIFWPASFTHAVELRLENLPARLEGLRIAHVSDLHISRNRRRFGQIIEEAAGMEADLAVLTGDYMTDEGDEPIALSIMRQLAEVLARRVRLGVFGVCGNHDSPAFREQLKELPVRWLGDDACLLAQEPILLAGFASDRVTNPDALAVLERMEAVTGGAAEREKTAATDRPLRLLLCHFPYFLPAAADMGFDLMFSGHTHGGQVRLPARRALYNSCDLPLHLSSGVLRLRRTQAAVSRGLGESGFPIRFFCPPHLPIYHLHRGPMPGSGGWHVENIRPW